MGREEDNRALLEFYAPIEDQMQNIIKVIGVGGGGCNAVRNMYDGRGMMEEVVIIKIAGCKFV